MTKVEALEKSIEMWKWMRDEMMEGRVRVKEDWFEKISDPYGFYCDSYLCHYAIEQSDIVFERTCDRCIIREWKHCSDIDSPYEQWRRNINQYLQKENYEEQIKKNILKGAVRMVDLLEKNLQREKENEVLEKILKDIQKYVIENKELRREEENV